MVVKIKTSNGYNKFLATKIKLQPFVKALDANIQRFTPVKTGMLRSNRRVSFTDTTGRIDILQPYALYVNDGTRPHTIVPKKRKALHFNGIFTKRVKHPGFAGRKFVEKGIDETSVLTIANQIE